MLGIIKKLMNNYILILLFIFFIILKQNRISFDNIDGNILLNNVSQLLKDNNINFWLDCGTLLGCIRENNFIKNDTDIDISTHIDNFDNIEDIIHNKTIMDKYNLEIYRCKRTTAIRAAGPGKKIISLYLKSNRKVYIDIYFPNWEPKLQQVEFQNNTFNVPKNPEEYLSILYGKNWKIPTKVHAKNWVAFDTGEDIVSTDYYKKNMGGKINI